MVDYYREFIELSLQQCMHQDYADKSKVKKHNVASKRLQQLKAEMKTIDCIDMLDMLLSHEDDRVKINAAALCIEMSVLTERAASILKAIIEFSKDRTLQFSAKMLLQSVAC